MRYLRIIFILLLLLLSLSIGLYAIFQTSWARLKLTEWIEEAASNEDISLKLEGLSGSLPFAPRLSSLSIRDQKGEWLRLEKVHLQWGVNILPLTWRIAKLTAEAGKWLRKPETESKPETSFTFSFTLPRIAVDHMEVAAFTVDPSITGQRHKLTLGGSIRTFFDVFHPKSELRIRSLEGPLTTFDARMENMHGQLNVHMLLKEAAGGLTGSLFALPENDALEMRLEALGAEEAWKGEATITTSSTTLLSSVFTIAQAEKGLRFVSHGNLHWLATEAYAPLRTAIGEGAAFILEGLWQEEELLTLERASFSSEKGKLEAKGTVEKKTDGFEVALEATLAELTHLPPAFAQLRDKPMRLHTKAKLQEEGVIHVDRLHVEAASIALDGKGELHLSEETVKGTLQLTMPSLTQIHPSLKGTLKGEGNFAGTFTALSGEWTSLWEEQGQALKLHSPFIVKDQHALLPAIRLTGEGVQASGNLDYSMKDMLLKGEIGLRAENFAALKPFLASRISGKGEANLRFEPKGKKQQLVLKGKFNDLLYAETKVRFLHLQLEGEDIAEDKGIRGKIEAEHIEMGSTLMPVLALEMMGNGKALIWKFRTHMKGTQPLNLEASGTWETLLSGWKLTCAKLTGQMAGKKLALIKPVLMIRKEETYAIEQAKLQVGEGALQLQGAYHDAAINLKTTLTKLPIALISSNYYDGDVSGTLAMTGTAKQPILTAELQAKGLASELKPGEGVALALKGRVEAGLLHLKAHVEETEGTLDASLNCPAFFTLSPFTFSLPKEGRLNGSLSSNAEIGLFLAFFLPPGQLMTGKAKTALTLGGTIAAPSAIGEITLSEGSYRNSGTGTVLSALRLRLHARGDRLEITEGEAQAGEGHVSFAGSSLLKSPYTMGITASFKDAMLINSKEATGSVNGQVRLNGDLSSSLLSGTLVLGPMEMRLPGSMESDVQMVKIRNKEVLPKQPWQREKTGKFSGGSPNVRLDLQLKAPQRVFVRGRGLETEIRGALTIRGSLDTPDIEGDLQAAHGTFTLLDRRLAITEGKLMFRGPMPPSPFIRMVAETTTRAMTAGVRIEGSLHEPSLTLTSTPSRPEDEIMAHLLFGRDVHTITPFQAVQLAQALQNLRGKGGGSAFDVVGKARSLLGVDRLSVGQREEGGFGVGAGKYINDKVYIGVEGGTAEEAGKVKAEIEISPRFSVETETGGRASGARFNWKKDY